MPLDYFSWDCVKAYVYTDKPASIDALEDNIEAFIRKIRAEMLERVCQNWTKRMEHLKRNRGQHWNSMDRTIDSNEDLMHFSKLSYGS